MLIALVVLVSGAWHPTWAWATEDRYDPQNHFMAPRPGVRGISAMQACRKQKETIELKFPTLKFSCETHL